MNCNKCGLYYENDNACKQHQIKCRLKNGDINDIIEDYSLNLLNIREVSKKYNISVGFTIKVLKNHLRSNGDGLKISFSKNPKKVSEETKKKISKGRKEYLKNNPDSIKWIGNDSAPSRKFKEILKNNNIKFVEEYKPLDNRFFNIDISFPDKKIGIEINGEQHYNRDRTLKEYYQNRHELISNEGWKLYEIPSTMVFNDEFINKFISKIKNDFNLDDVDYSLYKKEKKINICSCGNEKSYGANGCKECYDKSIRKRKVERPSYNDLIKEIEESGYAAVGRKYGVSGNSIKKWVKLYEKYE